ncbi:hypothetical protein HELRODRAFT_160694 [Helobdella robusta]|uniref:Protein OS-9 n=1 Tax=Helobdella robusta TaxID=6412 RepID=T1EQM0_HELRO|nr:hypothetical protein HELRODRAFT_160694 [Helobdella robusta]ESO06513.1 hypothetical protein HELRODRAFT_160694 [Helobdella robusta]
MDTSSLLNVNNRLLKIWNGKMDAIYLSKHDKDTENKENIILSSKFGQQYQCQFDSYNEISEKVREDGVSNSKLLISDLLKPLEDKPCLILTTGWWTYEFCYKKQIKQYHISDKKISGDIIILGHYSEDFNWSDAQSAQAPEATMHYHSQQYVNGTVCDLTKSLRRTEIRFRCKEGLQDTLDGVEEPLTCTYILHVSTNLVCRHPLLRTTTNKNLLPIICNPVLNELEYREYLEVQKQLEELEAEESKEKLKKLEGRDLERYGAEALNRFGVIEVDGASIKFFVLSTDGFQNFDDTLNDGSKDGDEKSEASSSADSKEPIDPTQQQQQTQQSLIDRKKSAVWKLKEMMSKEFQGTFGKREIITKKVNKVARDEIRSNGDSEGDEQVVPATADADDKDDDTIVAATGEDKLHDDVVKGEIITKKVNKVARDEIRSNGDSEGDEQVVPATADADDKDDDTIVAATGEDRVDGKKDVDKVSDAGKKFANGDDDDDDSMITWQGYGNKEIKFKNTKINIKAVDRQVRDLMKKKNAAAADDENVGGGVPAGGDEKDAEARYKQSMSKINDGSAADKTDSVDKAGNGYVIAVDSNEDDVKSKATVKTVEDETDDAVENKLEAFMNDISNYLNEQLTSVQNMMDVADDEVASQINELLKVRGDGEVGEGSDVDKKVTSSQVKVDSAAAADDKGDDKSDDGDEKSKSTSRKLSHIHKLKAKLSQLSKRIFNYLNGDDDDQDADGLTKLVEDTKLSFSLSDSNSDGDDGDGVGGNEKKVDNKAYDEKVVGDSRVEEDGLKKVHSRDNVAVEGASAENVGSGGGVTKDAVVEDVDTEAARNDDEDKSADASKKLKTSIFGSGGQMTDREKSLRHMILTIMKQNEQNTRDGQRHGKIEENYAFDWKERKKKLNLKKDEL